MSTRIRVRVPHAVTVLIGPTGDQVQVKIDETGAYADILEDDARLILFSGLPASVPWREANPGLVDTVKPLPTARGASLAAIERAAENSRSINPFDRAGIARDVLALWRKK